jgi:hypothetical protein
VTEVIRSAETGAAGRMVSGGDPGWRSEADPIFTHSLQQITESTINGGRDARMSLERSCRLLMTLAAVLGVTGVAVGRAHSVRFLAVSGCLVMAALALLLLAPKPATPAERRSRVAPEQIAHEQVGRRQAAPERAPEQARQSYRVPQQRVATAATAPQDAAAKTGNGEDSRAA